MTDVPDIFAPAGGRMRLRLWSAALTLVLVLAVQVTEIRQAQAFEIFGLELFEPEKSDEPPVIDPLAYKVELEVRGGENLEDLRKRLEAASTLVVEQEKPVSGSVGLISRSVSDFERLVGVLYEEARYGGLVEITLAGKSIEGLSPDTDLSGFAPVPVRIVVTPGPQFTLGKVAIQGEEIDEYDPAAYGLVSGEPARSTAILEAELRVVDALRKLGRPLAKVTAREVVADHRSNRLDVTLAVSEGPEAPFGATSVEGEKDVNEDFIAYMADIEPGEIYNPETLDRAARQLADLDVFTRVTVRGRDSLAADGSVPVDIKVDERKFRYFGLGATYSSIDGGGLEAYWGHRNLMGRAEKLRIEGSISGLGRTGEYEDLTYRAAILFEKPGVLGPPSRFTSKLVVAQENPDAYRRFSVNAAAGIARELSDTDTLSAGVDVEYALLTDSFNTERETLTLALPVEYIRDTRDDKLNPTRGYRLLAAVEPAYETIGQNFFVKVRGEASSYRALDKARRFVLAGRVAAGSIFGSELAGVPANRRFYSGGGGSVRGYAYQGIGPQDAAGDPTGGLSFLELSGELRIGVTENIGIVPFVDAGMVSTDSGFGGAEMKVGAGIGLRYKTPFGPLRLDFAVPLNRDPGDPEYGIYAGIGQAF